MEILSALAPRALVWSQKETGRGFGWGDSLFPGSSEASWTDVTVPPSARSPNHAQPDIATAIRAISSTLSY